MRGGGASRSLRSVRMFWMTKVTIVIEAPRIAHQMAMPSGAAAQDRLEDAAILRCRGCRLLRERARRPDEKRARDEQEDRKTRSQFSSWVPGERRQAQV